MIPIFPLLLLLPLYSPHSFVIHPAPFSSPPTTSSAIFKCITTSMVGCTPRRGANASETRLPTSPVQREDTHRSHLRSLERSPKGPGSELLAQRGPVRPRRVLAKPPEERTQSSTRAQGHEVGVRETHSDCHPALPPQGGGIAEWPVSKGWATEVRTWTARAPREGGQGPILPRRIKRG